MSTNAVAKIDFDKEQMAVIEAQFFPAGVTAVERNYCFSVAKELGLNVLLKEIHFVPRRSKVGDKWSTKIEPMVGRDGFLSIAHRTGQLGGMETSCSIKDVPQMDSKGQWIVKPELVAECTVWRKDCSKKFTGQVSYSEYFAKNSEGKPSRFWAEKPETMLKKVAESQVLRKAFNIHGVYCPEEIGAGFENEGGDIIQSVDAEFSRVEPDKTRLSIVVKPPPEEPPPPPPAAPPVVIDDESEWPEPPQERHAGSSTSDDDVVGQIISLLEAKNIEHEIDMENGIISAKSYNERTLLKDSGFKWNPDNKKWQFTFEPDPF